MTISLLLLLVLCFVSAATVVVVAFAPQAVTTATTTLCSNHRYPATTAAATHYHHSITTAAKTLVAASTAAVTRTTRTKLQHVLAASATTEPTPADPAADPAAADTTTTITTPDSSNEQVNKNADDEDSDDYDDEETSLMKKLLFIAKRLKLEIFDLDEGIFGFESQDSKYGIEVVTTTLPVLSNFVKEGGLGLVLTEVAGNTDGRGLVLVSDVIEGSAAANAQSAAIHVGDTIVGISVTKNTKNGQPPTILFRERCTALNYDRTVEIIGRAKEAAGTNENDDGTINNNITLELNRLVPRAEIIVQVVDEDDSNTHSSSSSSTQEIHALAGENLRRMLLRKGIKLYDAKTKRFDMPYAVGDCAGEGLCGTCLVQILQGAELLNEQDHMEQIITKGRPASWRASCRTIVGVDNKPGVVKIRIKPQSDYEDELNPGVRDIN